MSNEREHVPYHERRLEQQMLDALMRIEELLKAFLVLLPVDAPAPEKEPDGSHTMTFTETKPQKGKRK